MSSDWNPPPWAGARVSPLEAFNRAIGQAVVNMGNAIAIELFGSLEQKAQLHAWQQRNREGRPKLNAVESDPMVYIRRRAAIERAGAKAHLRRRMDAMYEEFGLTREIDQ